MKIPIVGPIYRKLFNKPKPFTGSENYWIQRSNSGGDSGVGSYNQFAEYPSYIGFDISPKALKLCQKIFQHDDTKNFRLMNEYKGETAQLTLSLDVIYHLIEDNIYYSYMERLFGSSERFVIIYSSDYDDEQINHEKRRQFTQWVKTNEPRWNQISHIPNRYPYNANNEDGSLSDFYIYEKA